jgi:hypothetical protein
MLHAAHMSLKANSFLPYREISRLLSNPVVTDLQGFAVSPSLEQHKSNLTHTVSSFKAHTRYFIYNYVYALSHALFSSWFLTKILLSNYYLPHTWYISHPSRFPSYFITKIFREIMNHAFLQYAIFSSFRIIVDLSTTLPILLQNIFNVQLHITYSLLVGKVKFRTPCNDAFWSTVEKQEPWAILFRLL